MKKKFVVCHNLEQFDDAARAQYLRDVSEFIGLDPDLGGLDTIWMRNETGPGQSLVVYARRGTAEILRNILGIEVKSLVHDSMGGSVVFTATGNKAGRQEVAVGSKSIVGLNGKQLDDAVMTASTRALRRLTMQFTTLGILDESEVVAVVGQDINPAGSAQLASSAIPPSFTTPTVAANNAPGKDVTVATVIDHEKGTIAHEKPLAPQFLGQQEQIDEATSKVGKKRTRKKPNTVALDDVEAEVVQKPAPVEAVSTAPQSVIADVKEVSANVDTSAPVAGMPTAEQMAEYRKRVSVFTAELPSSENLGSVQKMRAFITKWGGVPPQQMTVAQWDAQLAWFEEFTARNSTKGLVKYINEMLGVK